MFLLHAASLGNKEIKSMNVSTQVALFIATSLAPSNKTEAALNMKDIFPLRAFLINLPRAIEHT